MEMLGGVLDVCFAVFFGVGQTLKRIVNTKWAVVTSHIRACLYFIFKKIPGNSLFYFWIYYIKTAPGPSLMGFLQGTFSTPENKSKFLPCDVGIPSQLFCQLVNKKKTGKKSRQGRSSGIYGTRCHRDIPCHWDPPIFSKRWGNPLTESASISNSCNICGHLEIAKVGEVVMAKSLDVPRVLGSHFPHVDHDGPWDFSDMGKSWECLFSKHILGSIRMLARHHETWHFSWKPSLIHEPWCGFVDPKHIISKDGGI